MELRQLKEQAGEIWVRRRYHRAEILYRQMVTLDPLDAQLWVRHAEALRKLHRNDDAVESYRHAAEVFSRAGRYQRAIAALKLAMELQPDEIELISALIRLEVQRTGVPSSAPVESIAIIEETVTGPGIEISVEEESWPQQRELSATCVAVKMSGSTPWVVMESTAPVTVRFTDRL